MMYKFHQGQSWPCMHFVRIECDSVGPVEKLTHGSCQLFAKVDFGLPRADFLSRVDLDLEASRSFRPTPQTKIWCNFVQSCFVRTLAYGTWLRSRVNVPCPAWGRAGDPVRKSNTASCVYTAMIEGMRYKVYLLLQGRVVHPVMDTDRAPRACTVSGLESFEAFPSGSLHGIIWYLAPRRA